jgi:hypothetical protein
MNSCIIYLASALLSINGAMKRDANSGAVFSPAKFLPAVSGVDFIKFSGKHPKMSTLGDAIPGGPYKIDNLKGKVDLWLPDYDADGNVISYTNVGEIGEIFDCQGITGHPYLGYNDCGSGGWSSWP